LRALRLFGKRCETIFGIHFAGSGRRDPVLVTPDERVFYDGFPDGKLVVEEILAAGDRTTVIGTWTGTHRGELQGLPTTGKRVTLSFISVTRFAAGKIIEHHTQLDAAGMMHQLMGAS
jgi:predicted ester cyclase